MDTAIEGRSAMMLWKLCVEMVPKTAWGNNLRSILTATEWDKLRKDSFEQDDYRCIFCGDSRRLHCHEKWAYVEDLGLQRLVRLDTVCPMCHHIKHLGRAELLCHQGKLNKPALIGHFCRVNGCSIEDFYTHRSESFKVWAYRSRMQWTLDLTVLERQVDVTTIMCRANGKRTEDQ